MSKNTQKVAFEEALTMTGFGKYNLMMTIVSGSTIAAMCSETFSVAFLVPASACELNTSNETQGLMAGVPLFGILLSSNIWGYLADTKGRRKILIVSLVLSFITGSCASLSPNWIVFCFFKFLSSSAVAGIFGLGTAYLSECSPESKRNTMIVLLTSIFLCSAGCMAAITIPILPLTFSYYIPGLGITFTSWRLLNLIYAMPALISILFCLFADESPKFLLSVGKDQKALDILKRIYAMNTGEKADSFEVKSVYLEEETASQTTKGLWASVVSQTTPLLKPPLLKNTLLLSLLFITVYFCVQPYTVWIPYMVDGFMKSLEKGDVGMTFCQMLRSSRNGTLDADTACVLNKTAMQMVLFMNCLLAVLNLFMMGAMACCGRKKCLIFLQLIAGVSALLMNFVRIWQLSAVLMIVYVAGTLNFGFLSTFSVDVFPTYVKAMGVCLTLMVGRGSSVLGINLLKSLLVNDCELSFFLFGGFTVFGGLVGFLLPSDKKLSEKKCLET